MLVSIIIPASNRAGAITDIIREVAQLPLEKEILVVDDGSPEGTRGRAHRLEKEIKELRGLYFPENRGKGFAIRAGVRAARGEIVVIQDAGREHPPRHIPRLVEELAQDPGLDAVFGARVLPGSPATFRRHYRGGHFLTGLVNLFGKAKLTDVTTGHKAVRWKILKDLQLEADGFEIEIEIAMKLLRRGFRVKEVPLAYPPRESGAGRKLRWIEGLRSVWIIIRRGKNPAGHGEAART